ncbi:MAG TPA: RMD1 family protein [Gammaproteobacteria bacterium]|nr:RMD1 family protein [Gammaproteobacteria bacterium]
MKEEPHPFAEEWRHGPVRALLIGESIDVRSLERADCLALSPMAVRTGHHGVAVITRYGVVVLFNVQPVEEVALLDYLKPLVGHRYPEPIIEEAVFQIDANGREYADLDGVIHLAEPSVPRLQLVADILAKSTILDHYEQRVAGVFDRIEPLAHRMSRRGTGGGRVRDLLHQIGDVLATRHRMVGRVEVTEKPELLWEHPGLERLHDRLADEYELAERDRALNRKLGIVAETIEWLLDLVHNRRSLRVEWYIVILIVVEILLTLYEMFVHDA